MDKVAKKTVALGFLGSTIDVGGPDRWSRWRPSVGLCQQEDLLVERFELLYAPQYAALAARVCEDIALVAPETDVRLREFEMGNPWDFEGVFGALYGFARDYPFDLENEEYLVHITTGTHVAQICLFLLTESRHLPARLVQTSPPKRRSTGPIEGGFQIIDLDLSRYDGIAARFAGEHREGVSLLKSGIETRNDAFNHQIDLLETIALRSQDPILLMGPTGAGKSQLARRVDQLKRGRQKLEGPFVEVNCATLRGDAAMSTLFGHELGAFTGAASARSGLLRAADGGLLFLDEIGELGLDEQSMLLRALEEKRFLPLGADQEVASDFQLIAGTNRRLEERVAEGHFREDLLARINLWTFRLPGLRDRIEDLEPNLDYELDQYAQRSGQRVSFNKEARQRYLAFATGAEGYWNANFRDLNASVTRMATLAEGGRIRVVLVDEEIARLRLAWRLGSASSAGEDAARGGEDLLQRFLSPSALEDIDLFDRAQLGVVLQTCRRANNLSEAGRRLFAASRRKKKSSNDADRLRKYLQRFGLDFAQVNQRPSSA